MSDMMSDRRIDPRYPLILHATVENLASGAKLDCRTSDISRTGCYIDTRKPFSSGTVIRVKLTQGRETIEVQGIVKYVSAGLGMGVRFADPVPAKQFAILQGWLEAAARQPA